MLECPRQWEDYQLVGGAVQVDAQLVSVQISWDVSELDSDFGTLAVKGLASLEQEGDIIPSGVVDESPHSCKGGTEAAHESN